MGRPRLGVRALGPVGCGNGRRRTQLATFLLLLRRPSQRPPARAAIWRPSSGPAGPSRRWEFEFQPRPSSRPSKPPAGATQCNGPVAPAKRQFRFKSATARPLPAGERKSCGELRRRALQAGRSLTEFAAAGRKLCGRISGRAGAQLVAGARRRARAARVGADEDDDGVVGGGGDDDADDDGGEEEAEARRRTLVERLGGRAAGGRTRAPRCAAMNSALGGEPFGSASGLFVCLPAASTKWLIFCA